MELQDRLGKGRGTRRKGTALLWRQRTRLSRYTFHAIVLTLLTAVAAPTYASDITVRFIEGPSNGADITGVWDISSEALSSVPLREFSLAIETNEEEGYRETITNGPWTTEDKKHDIMRATWNTSDEPPILNGIYKLSTTAMPQEGNAVTSSIDGLKVNNRPQKPVRPEMTAKATPFESSHRQSSLNQTSGTTTFSGPSLEALSDPSVVSKNAASTGTPTLLGAGSYGINWSP